MTDQEIADVRLALVKVAAFAKYPRPRSLDGWEVLVPCAREHTVNAEWAAACDRLSAAGVLDPLERDVWYTVTSNVAGERIVDPPRVQNTLHPLVRSVHSLKFVFIPYLMFDFSHQLSEARPLLE